MSGWSAADARLGCEHLRADSAERLAEHSHRCSGPRLVGCCHRLGEGLVEGRYGADMLHAAGDARPLGSAEPRLVFGDQARRLLLLDEKPAFELSPWCGTCQFLFQRLEGANDSLSLDELQSRLSAGLDDLDDEVIRSFGSLLEQGTYLPLLLSVQPRLTLPGQAGDYYSEEQVSSWGMSGFWGLPEYPATAYYRTFETTVDDGTHLFEFVVPMLPPAWNDTAKVAEYTEMLASSDRPTAVAVSTLDVCQPALANQSTDYYAHWGLTHFLLDGHHKTHAAAQSGRPLRLLSLLSLGGSLAAPEQVGLVPHLRSQPAVRRPCASSPPAPGEQ